MAYFLKVSKPNNGSRRYLQIYESFYDKGKKTTTHRTYKSLSSIETLIKSGIYDSIAYYQKEVDKLNEDKKLAGYNLLVTSKTKMKDKDIYDTYHNLWRIEESFRIMKSDLDARPVYLQKMETIQGHFLICYLCVLLERIFQFIILKNKYPSETIYKFFKEFEVIKADNKYINITSRNEFIFDLADTFKIPINQYYLSEKQINKVLNTKL